MITEFHWMRIFPSRNRGHHEVFPFVFICGSDFLLVQPHWASSGLWVYVGASYLHSLRVGEPKACLRTSWVVTEPSAVANTVRALQLRGSRGSCAPHSHLGFHSWTQLCTYKDFKNIVSNTFSLWQEHFQAVYTIIIDRDECDFIVFTVSSAQCI